MLSRPSLCAVCVCVCVEEHALEAISVRSVCALLLQQRWWLLRNNRLIYALARGVGVTGPSLCSCEIRRCVPTGTRYLLPPYASTHRKTARQQGTHTAHREGLKSMLIYRHTHT